MALLPEDVEFISKALITYNPASQFQPNWPERERGGPAKCKLWTSKGAQRAKNRRCSMKRLFSACKFLRRSLAFSIALHTNPCVRTKTVMANHQNGETPNKCVTWL